VKAKWQPKALREYLKDPAKDYPQHPDAELFA
jgi:hypothetical protein